MIEEIAKIIETHRNLAVQAHKQYSPLANNIIATQNKNVNHICYTLDGILDFCYDNQMLLLYRRLCRYLYNIDKEATAFYIQAYREMWDEEGKQFGNH